MKKKDYILVAGILGIAIAFFLISGGWNREKGAMIEIRVKGKLEGTYSLSEDQTIKIRNTNKLVIENGCADMVDATCPDKLCVHQKAISAKDETLVCLPNKVIVTVVNGKKNDIDATSN